MFYKIIMVLPFIIINIPDSLGHPLVIKVISLSLIQDYIIDWIELGQEDTKGYEDRYSSFSWFIDKSDVGSYCETTIHPTVQYRIISSQ